MSKINIQRTSEYVNRLRNLGVYIDDKKVGTVSNGETKEFEIPAGSHLICCKIDWCSSPQLSFKVDEAETRSFKVGGFKNSNWLMPLSLGIIILNIVLNAFFGIHYGFYMLIPVFLLLMYYVTFGRKQFDA